MTNEDTYIKIEHYTKTKRQVLAEYLQGIKFAVQDLFESLTTIPKKEGTKWVETNDPEEGS